MEGRYRFCRTLVLTKCSTHRAARLPSRGAMPRPCLARRNTTSPPSPARSQHQRPDCCRDGRCGSGTSIVSCAGLDSGANESGKFSAQGIPIIAWVALPGKGAMACFQPRQAMRPRLRAFPITLQLALHGALEDWKDTSRTFYRKLRGSKTRLLSPHQLP